MGKWPNNVQYFGSNIAEGVAESWVEVEMSWVEVDGAGWRMVHGLIIPGGGWWVYGLVIPVSRCKCSFSKTTTKEYAKNSNQSCFLLT